MSDPDRRQDDILVAQLTQRFNDFIERYDRDCGGNNQWRNTVDAELKAQSKILNEISPAYTRGKWIAGLVMIGSLGIAIKSFWSHIRWQ